MSPQGYYSEFPGVMTKGRDQTPHPATGDYLSSSSAREPSSTYKLKMPALTPVRDGSHMDKMLATQERKETAPYRKK